MPATHDGVFADSTRKDANLEHHADGRMKSMRIEHSYGVGNAKAYSFDDSSAPMLIS